MAIIYIKIFWMVVVAVNDGVERGESVRPQAEYTTPCMLYNDEYAAH